MAPSHRPGLVRAGRHRVHADDLDRRLLEVLVSERPEQLYTASRLKVLRECLRRHYYRYELGIRGAETDQMRFGTTMHLALEAWYLEWRESGDPEARLAAALWIVDSMPHAFERVYRLLLGLSRKSVHQISVHHHSCLSKCMSNPMLSFIEVVAKISQIRSDV